MGVDGSRTGSRRKRRIGFWAAGFLLAGAFYLVLIDTLDPPELWTGLVVAALSATILELSRAEAFREPTPSPAGLMRVWRVFVRIPADVVRLTVAAFDQTLSRRPARGRLRVVDFDAPGEDSRAIGRRALAEAVGSLAPNTIVIGVDRERRLLVVHQLEPGGDRRALDPLDLG